MLHGEILKDDLVSAFKYQGLVDAGTFQEKLCLISSDSASFPSCSAGSPCRAISVVHWTRVHIGRYHPHTKFVTFCCCCKFLPKKSSKCLHHLLGYTHIGSSLFLNHLACTSTLPTTLQRQGLCLSHIYFGNIYLQDVKYNIYSVNLVVWLMHVGFISFIRRLHIFHFVFIPFMFSSQTSGFVTEIVLSTNNINPHPTHKLENIMAGIPMRK